MNNRAQYNFSKCTNNITEEANDLFELLHCIEAICRLSQKNTWVPKFLQSLNESLMKYPNRDIHDVIKNLKEHRIINRNRAFQSPIPKLSLEELTTLSLSDLKTIISNPHIQKNDLLQIGDIRLGIPKGSSRKISKKELQARVLSAINNIETMSIIGDKSTQ